MAAPLLRRIAIPLLAGGVATTSVGIAINLATENKDSISAWLAVVVFTAFSAATSIWLHLRLQDNAPELRADGGLADGGGENRLLPARGRSRRGWKIVVLAAPIVVGAGILLHQTPFTEQAPQQTPPPSAEDTRAPTPRGQTPTGQWLSAEETWVTLWLHDDGSFVREDPLAEQLDGQYSVTGTVITFTVNGHPAGTARWSETNQSVEWSRSADVTELYVRAA